MNKSTFKILFYIRKNQVNKYGTVCIMVRLTVCGDVTQFSSKLNVGQKAWDVKQEKAAGNSVKAHRLNDLLEDMRTSLKNHYRDIELHESFVTAEKIRNAFLVLLPSNGLFWNYPRNIMRMHKNWLVSVKQKLL